MTTSKTTSRWEYFGNGVTPEFQYDNKIFADTELKVFFDGVEQALGGDYTVTGVGLGDGGNVVPTAVLAQDVVLVILRNVADIQDLDLVNNDDEPSELIENALDRRAIVSQQQQEQLDRAIVYPEEEDAIPSGVLPSKAVRAGKLAAYDDADGRLGNTETLLSQIDAAVAAATQAGTIMSEFQFEGDGVETVFTIPGVQVASRFAVLVHVNGLKQAVTDYSLTPVDNDSPLTFTEPPPFKAQISVRIIGFASTQPQTGLDLSGNGAPEGAVVAPVGATFRRLDGGAGTTFYVKESGSGDTGWVAK